MNDLEIGIMSSTELDYKVQRHGSAIGSIDLMNGCPGVPEPRVGYKFSWVRTPTAAINTRTLRAYGTTRRTRRLVIIGTANRLVRKYQHLTPAVAYDIALAGSKHRYGQEFDVIRFVGKHWENDAFWEAAPESGESHLEWLRNFDIKNNARLSGKRLATTVAIYRKARRDANRVPYGVAVEGNRLVPTEL